MDRMYTPILSPWCQGGWRIPEQWHRAKRKRTSQPESQLPRTHPHSLRSAPGTEASTACTILPSLSTYLLSYHKASSVPGTGPSNQ